MKNIPQRYDINRPRPRHGHKYTKYKLCLGNVKQDWVELKKACIYSDLLKERVANCKIFTNPFQYHGTKFVNIGIFLGQYIPFTS